MKRSLRWEGFQPAGLVYTQSARSEKEFRQNSDQANSNWLFCYMKKRNISLFFYGVHVYFSRVNHVSYSCSFFSHFTLLTCPSRTLVSSSVAQRKGFAKSSLSPVPHWSKQSERFYRTVPDETATLENYCQPASNSAASCAKHVRSGRPSMTPETAVMRGGQTGSSPQ